jgi:hypothetical protein
MKTVLLVINFLLVVLWPHAVLSQSATSSVKLSCAQCGVVVKPEARFCPQCGVSFVNSVRVIAPADAPRLASNAVAQDSARVKDSAALKQRELVRALLADPEFERIVKEKVRTQMTAEELARSRSKSEGGGEVLKIMGAVTLGSLVLSLLLGN